MQASRRSKGTISIAPFTSTAPLRIGVVGYLNSWLYREACAAAGADVMPFAPRACGAAFAAGTLDAALVPTVHAARLVAAGMADDDLSFGLAVRGPTSSVFLTGPPDLRDPRYSRIATNGDSATSVALARLILTERFGHNRVDIVRDETAASEPCLLIGDAALRRFLCLGENAGADLGDLWLEWTGLPMVFARWVTRPGLETPTRRRINECLRQASLDLHAVRHAEPGIKTALNREAERGNLPVEVVRGYLSRFNYALGPDERRGEHVFLDRHARLSARRSPHEGFSFWTQRKRLSVGPRAQIVGDSCGLRELRRKASHAQRFDRSEIVRLLSDFPASELFALAHARRLSVTEPEVVTYVIDSNPNYSNICDTNCSFCAFYRPTARVEGAYAHSVGSVMKQIEAAVARGATTILLQGGHHPNLPLSYYLDLVRLTTERFPHVTPHFWSAGEVRRMAEVSELTVAQVLAALYDAGQRSLPGGGAEILSDRVRAIISPLKGSVSDWLEVHRAAHRTGMSSTATMMYGHVEMPQDIADHLVAIRALQDETSGFTAFVPWSFKPGPTPLARRLRLRSRAGPGTYLRVLAVARLALDNFAHIQASFFSEGWDAGETALHCGADDVGGTLLEENVHKAAGFENPTPLAEVRRRIRKSGFAPRQRDTHYRPIASAEMADEVTA